MGRVAVTLVLLTGEAAASPALSLAVDGSAGEQWAHRSGWVRDDNILGLTLGIGVRDFVAFDVAVREDTDRVEPELGLGVRVRPWTGECWTARWSPYLRAEIGAAAASHLGSNFDLIAGAGHWGRLTDHLRWFAELDVIGRIGEYDALSLRVDAGLAVATSAFWR
jgi:hypothetical protein